MDGGPPAAGRLPAGAGGALSCHHQPAGCAACGAQARRLTARSRCANPAAIDMYIYVTADMSTSICQLGTATAGVVAYAMACDFDYDFNRPIQGGINICYSRCGGRGAAAAARVGWVGVGVGVWEKGGGGGGVAGGGGGGGGAPSKCRPPRAGSSWRVWTTTAASPPWCTSWWAAAAPCATLQGPCTLLSGWLGLAADCCRSWLRCCLQEGSEGSLIPLEPPEACLACAASACSRLRSHCPAGGPAHPPAPSLLPSRRTP